MYLENMCDINLYHRLDSDSFDVMSSYNIFIFQHIYDE